WPWEARYAPFAALGTDTFLAVSPGGSILYTADADVIHQITTRKLDFPKPTIYYKSLELFGTNVASTEGADWRRHRKLVGPAFGESTNRAVWYEGRRKTRFLLQTWAGATAQANVVRTAQPDLMNLTLDVLGKVAFGLEIEDGSADVPGKISKDEMGGFLKSLGEMLDYIMALILLPRWLLKWGPFSSLRKANQSFDDVRAFTNDILVEKRARLQAKGSDATAASGDLLFRLIQASTDQSLAEEKDTDRVAKTSKIERFSDSEVLGNVFVFLFAGHDSTAGSIHSLIMFMALHPACQRRLQEAIDAATEGSDPEDYSTVVPKLLESVYVNAVINETLRLTTPAPIVPKHVPKNGTPKSLLVNSKEASVPPGTLIKVMIACAQRNPKYWESKPVGATASHWTSWPPSNLDNDLEGFIPERWIQVDPSEEGAAERLMTPPPGAFIPFSDGARSCLGKRFAIMEMFAVITVLFSTHSVELAVQDMSPEEDVEQASRERREELWEAAAQKTNQTWRQHMTSSITLKLRNAHIPMRIVKRGEELF
ncbi:cytochrome P450, partial [Thozetella sp. PMI_491]